MTFVCVCVKFGLKSDDITKKKTVWKFRMMRFNLASSECNWILHCKGEKRDRLYGAHVGLFIFW